MARELVRQFVDAKEIVRREIIEEVKGNELKDIVAAAKRIFDDEMGCLRERKSVTKGQQEISKLVAEIQLLDKLKDWVIQDINANPQPYMDMLKVHREMK